MNCTPIMNLISQMNWGTVPDWVSAAANVVLLLVAFIGIQQGVESLNAWRKETVGRRRIELAEDILTDFYDVRQILNSARSRNMGWSVHVVRIPRDIESQELKRHRDLYWASLDLIHQSQPLFGRVSQRHNRASAVFGLEAGRFYDELERLALLTQQRAQKLLDLDPTSGDLKLKSLELSFWIDEFASSDLTEDLNNLMNRVEAYFRPYVNGSEGVNQGCDKIHRD